MGKLVSAQCLKINKQRPDPFGSLWLTRVSRSRRGFENAAVVRRESGHPEGNPARVGIVAGAVEAGEGAVAVGRELAPEFRNRAGREFNVDGPFAGLVGLQFTRAGDVELEAECFGGFADLLAMALLRAGGFHLVIGNVDGLHAFDEEINAVVFHGAILRNRADLYLKGLGQFCGRDFNGDLGGTAGDGVLDGFNRVEESHGRWCLGGGFVFNFDEGSNRNWGRFGRLTRYKAVSCVTISSDYLYVRPRRPREPLPSSPRADTARIRQRVPPSSYASLPVSAKNHYLESVTLRRDAVADWSAFPFCVPALRHFEGLDLHPKVTFFVGENGTGKSTLLEALAEKLGFRASGGSRVGSLVAPAYESALAPLLRIARTHNRPSDGFFLRAESFHNWATELDELEATPF